MTDVVDSLREEYEALGMLSYQGTGITGMAPDLREEDIEGIRKLLRRAGKEIERLRGWPEIKQVSPVAHSPIDTYACDNPDCENPQMWQFAPDNHDLDETVVQCPTCGVEGKLIFRRFRYVPQPDG